MAHVTRVGLAIDGDNLYRGYSVKDELVGQASFWRMMSLAIRGPELSDAQCHLLDVILSASAAADPRIWPLKMVRVAGSSGGFWSALGSALLMVDGASVGASPAAQVVRMLRVLKALLSEGAPLEEVIEQIRVESGGRLAGFGVAGRGEDERYLAIKGWFDQHYRQGEADTTYWNLFHQIQPIIKARYGLQPNLLTCQVSLLMDMGFNEDQIPIMVTLSLLPCYIANAYEATVCEEAKMPERLDSTRVKYVGKSSRSVATREGVDQG